MVKDKNMWEQLRQLLKDNFSNDSEEELEMKFNSLKNYDEDWYEHNIVLFAPEFMGQVLCVGICCEGTKKTKFFYTAAGKEVTKLLNFD